MRVAYALAVVVASLLGVSLGYALASITTVQPATAPTSTVTVEYAVAVDALGRYVRVANVSRVVSLAPAITELVFALGLEGYLVGVDDFSDHPPKVLEMVRLGKVARVGGYWSPSVEAIASLRPTLVLADAGTTPHRVLEGKFRELGISVVYLRGSWCRDLHDVVSDIRLLGAIFNAMPRADELVENISRRVEAVREAVRSRNLGGTRVLFLIGPPSWGLYAFGGNTIVSYAIEVAGGTNVAKELLGWPRLSYEYIVEKDPEVIVISIMAFQDPEALKRELLSTPLAGTRAFREGRVYVVTGDADNAFSRGRVADAVELMARILYPEIFGTLARPDVVRVG